MEKLQLIMIFCRLQSIVLLVLALFSSTYAENDGGHLLATTSSYARVQYANKPNISRRFGIHRDPTIQYVSFDEIFNKYKTSNGMRRPEPVILGSTRTSSVSSKEESVITSVKENSDNSQTLDSSHIGKEGNMERLDGISAHSIPPHLYNVDDNEKSSDLHPNWEEAPDLTNGWKFKYLNYVNDSKQPSSLSESVEATETGEDSLINRTYDDVASHFNKGVDQVYAYSSFYKNYNGENNNPADREDAAIAQEFTMKSTTVGGAGEYAHAIGDGSEIFNSGNDAPTTNPPEVKEASWTDKTEDMEKNSVKPKFDQQPKPVIRERVDVSSSDEVGGMQVAHGTIGGQSAWRPFAGPTIPMTNPTTRSNVGNIFKVTTTGIDISTTPSTTQATSSDTLFYSEAQKAALAHNRVPGNPNNIIFDGPTLMGSNNPNRNPPHSSQLPHRPLPPQQFPARPNLSQSNRPQVLVLPNMADNEIANGMRPPSRPTFQMPTIPNGNDRPANIHFSQDRPSINIPPLHPVSEMHRPPNFISQNQPLPHQQRPQPQIGIQNNPSSPRPLHFNRFPEQPKPTGPPFLDRFSSLPPNMGENPNNRPFRPNLNGFNRVPSGPVSLSPQLLPNQGRPIPQPGPNFPLSKPGPIGTNPNNPLAGPPISQPGPSFPLPKPGPLGTSPNNPLPGPPIPLPGIPSGPITIANLPGGSILGPHGRPNNDNNNPERNTLNRQDGPISLGHDNFIGPMPPQHGFDQRNPNMPPNNFLPPNFQRPPFPQGFQPSPKPQQPTSSATSLIKSFFSRFFPFARSLKDDDVPIVDYDAFTNGTNITALALDPELFTSFIESSKNATRPIVLNIERFVVDDEHLKSTPSNVNASTIAP